MASTDLSFGGRGGKAASLGLSLKLDSIGEAMQARLEGTTWLPGDTRLTVGKAKDGHNPHAFVVSIGGPDVIGAVRVKVEMWQAEEAALCTVKVVVAPVKLARGRAAGMQTFVPTADLKRWLPSS